MKYLDSILLLRKCGHFELAKSILDGILSHGNQVVLYSDYEKKILNVKMITMTKKLNRYLNHFYIMHLVH